MSRVASTATRLRSATLDLRVCKKRVETLEKINEALNRKTKDLEATVRMQVEEISKLWKTNERLLRTVEKLAGRTCQSELANDEE